MRLCSLALLLTLVVSDVAEAQKRPAPPLYPKHRRGIYTNGEGIEAIDATPQSPPLNTDDPGVPGQSAYEINLAANGDFSADRRVIAPLFVDANYGLVIRRSGHELPAQISMEFPISGAKEPGHPFRIGVGEAELGFKLNFYINENRGAAIAFYPRLEFAVPGTNALKKDIAEKGQTLVLPLLVQKEFKFLTVVTNGGIQKPIHDSERNTTGSLSFGIGRALTPHLAIMGDIYGESAFDFRRDRLVTADFGVMRRVRGMIFFSSLGHSLVSNGTSGHLYAGIGVKMQSRNSK